MSTMADLIILRQNRQRCSQPETRRYPDNQHRRQFAIPFLCPAGFLLRLRGVHGLGDCDRSDAMHCDRRWIREESGSGGGRGKLHLHPAGITRGTGADVARRAPVHLLPPVGSYHPHPDRSHGQRVVVRHFHILFVALASECKQQCRFLAGLSREVWIGKAPRTTIK